MTATERPSRHLGPDDFVDAAAALVRAEGLHAFTMRRLAEAVGMSPMAVYRHFPHKQDLFAALVERLWQAAGDAVESQDDADPAEAIVQSLVRIRALLVEQGELALLVASAPMPSPALTRVMEAGFERLRRAGFAEHELVEIQLVFGRLTANSAVHEAAASLAARLTGRPRQPTTPTSAQVFERTVRLVLRALLHERGLASP